MVGLLGGKSRDFLSTFGSVGGQTADDRIIMLYTMLQLITGAVDIPTLQVEVLESNEAAGTAERIISLLSRAFTESGPYNP